MLKRRRIEIPVASDEIMKILLLRFSSIGDIVLTTPVIRCLKEQVPGCEIHFVTKESFRPVLANNPYIDRIHSFADDISTLYATLREERYDRVIDLHNNSRSFLLKRALKIPAVSFRKLNIEKWLLVNLKIDRLPHMHIVDRYMETVAGLGVTNDGKGLDYFIRPEDESILDRIPPTHRSGYTVVVIGAKHPTKKLPAEKLAELCKGLAGPVVLLGGPEDKADGDLLAASSGGHVFNACGMGNINESAAIVKHARLVITHDTGLMHIAAAMKRPVISIWGNTVPAFGMTPYYGDSNIHSVIAQVDGLSCRPCSKIGFTKCPKGHFSCMMNQDLPGIIAKANAFG